MCAAAVPDFLAAMDISRLMSVSQIESSTTSRYIPCATRVLVDRRKENPKMPVVFVFSPSTLLSTMLITALGEPVFCAKSCV